MNLGYKVDELLDKYIGERLTDTTIDNINYELHNLIRQYYCVMPMHFEIPDMYVVRDRLNITNADLRYNNGSGMFLYYWINDIREKKLKAPTIK